MPVDFVRKSLFCREDGLTYWKAGPQVWYGPSRGKPGEPSPEDKAESKAETKAGGPEGRLLEVDGQTLLEGLNSPDLEHRTERQIQEVSAWAEV
jgi:hypothetical protein